MVSWNPLSDRGGDSVLQRAAIFTVDLAEVPLGFGECRPVTSPQQPLRPDGVHVLSRPDHRRLPLGRHGPS